jgi:hypothetical protein
MRKDDLPRNDHELLESKTATSVRATVEDILDCIVSKIPLLVNFGSPTRYRENVGLLGASQVGDVCVERYTLLGGSSLCNSH